MVVTISREKRVSGYVYLYIKYTETPDESEEWLQQKLDWGEECYLFIT